MESKKKLSVPNEAITRSTAQMAEKTGNLYETVMVIAKRANQIAHDQQEELKSKLEEFNKGTDTLRSIRKRRADRGISLLRTSSQTYLNSHCRVRQR